MPLLREDAGSMQGQPERVAMWAVTSKAEGVGLPESLEAHILPQCIPDARHENLGFNVCHVAFQYSLV